MAEPVLIHTFEEAERGIPLSDEDVARGHLEDGWVPVISCDPLDYQPGLLGVLPTNSLTFFECTWQLNRTPGAGGTWLLTLSMSTMRKTRLPIEEDEELVLEPAGIGMLREHTVIVCKSREVGYTDHVAVCYTENAMSLRIIGHQPIRDSIAAVGPYDCFLVCKQPRIPFVLK